MLTRRSTIIGLAGAVSAIGDVRGNDKPLVIAVSFDG